MRRTIGLLVTLTLALLVAPLFAAAQPPGKPIPRIGELDVTSRCGAECARDPGGHAGDPHDPHRHGARGP
jgi:hypothetical protein